MKIQTVNQLISVFKDISTRHYQINGFGVGDNWENGTSEKMHPVLWINPTTATMPSSDNGYKTFEIDFEVRVFDLVNKDESNEKEVLSDCIDILKDIITEFKGHPYYVNSQLNIIDDINFEAFTEEFDEEVSGWVCEISLMTPVLTSFCGIPSADITGFEFPGADCPDVNVLCPVFVEDVTGVYPIVVTTTGTTKEVSIVGGGLSDTFVISGVYDNGTLTLTRNDDVDVVVTGFDTGGDNDYTTSATLSGNIITFDRTDTVGAYSVDLTTAINSAPDKFVSSGAYDAINNKIVLTLNDASTVDIDTSAISGGGGGGIDNVTTAEKSALSPSVGDFVYDTDLSSLQRYDGSNWISVSNGYGLIEVITDSDNGIPKYFTDLQTALDTCKTGNNIVALYDNITLTSQINILSSSGFNFNSLTINFNGFQIENNEANNSYVFNIAISSIVEFSEPIIYRRNGTGTHFAIKTLGSIDLKLSGKGYIFCENERTIWLEGFKQNSFLDGNGVTIETSSGAYAFLVYGDNTYVSNFNIISGGARGSFFQSCSISSINSKHSGSEEAIWAYNSCKMLINSYISSSGKGAEITPSDCVLDNNRFVSTGECVFNSGIINGGYYESTNDHAVKAVDVINDGYFYSVNGLTADLSGTEINGGVFKSLNSIPLGLANNGVVSNIVAISINDTCLAGNLASSSNIQTFVDCKFISKYNNVNGHSVDISSLSTGTLNFIDCKFIVANSSANNIYSSGGKSATVSSCSLIGATTPINANITVTASTDLGNGNRQI